MSDTPSEYPRYFSNCELRVVDTEGKRPKIVGYAAVWNMRSQDLGGFVEEIAPGAFTEALASGDDVLALVEHNPGQILGRRSMGTLSLAQDDRGLRVEIDPPNTTVGNDAVENVRRGDIKGMSFRFPRGAKDSWRLDKGESVRTLHKVGLREVTLTSIPAYDSTSASVRALNDQEEAEMRSYYEAQIKALQPVPLATPKLKDAQRRLMLVKGHLTEDESRAMMQMDDKSLIYTCRCAVSYIRQAFDQMQSLIDTASAVTGALTEQDQVAVNDCLGEVLDLQGKTKLCRKTLEQIGAKDDDTAAA
jgi:HK97 family phage prohead protease